VGVALRSGVAGVSGEDLDCAEGDPGLDQVGAIGMTQGMEMSVDISPWRLDIATISASLPECLLARQQVPR